MTYYVRGSCMMYETLVSLTCITHIYDTRDSFIIYDTHDSFIIYETDTHVPRWGVKGHNYEQLYP